MAMHETEHDERLGERNAPVRISARPAPGGVGQQRGPGLLPGFARTSEFALLVLGIIAVMVAAAVDSGFGAQRAWTLATVLAAAYIISRGLAKR
jgi:hypothetical protein